MGDVVEVELGEVGRPGDEPGPAPARRPRLRLAVGAGVVALLAAGVLLDAPAPTPLADGPVRGTLAGDRAVLDALGDRATDVTVTDGGRRWRADWRAGADVLLATDVAGSRVALVELTQRSGLSLRRAQVWLTGPRGAAVAGLEPVGTRAAAGTAVTFLPGGGRDGGALALAVAPPSTPVTAAGAAWVNSDATVDWPPDRPEALDGGAWALDVDDDGGARLLTVGSATRTVLPTGPWSGAGATALEEVLRPRACCGSAPDVTASRPGAERLLAALAAAQRASGTAATASRRSLLWSGALGTTRVDVVSVVAPSGAQVLTLHDADDGRTWSVTLRALQPEALAAVLDGRRLALVGPANAVAAQVVPIGGDMVEVPLVHGVGTVLDAHPDVDVTFLAADGRLLAQARPVRAGTGGPVAALATP